MIKNKNNKIRDFQLRLNKMSRQARNKDRFSELDIQFKRRQSTKKGHKKNNKSLSKEEMNVKLKIERNRILLNKWKQI